MICVLWPRTCCDDHGQRSELEWFSPALFYHQVRLLTLFVRATPVIIQGYSTQGYQGF